MILKMSAANGASSDGGRSSSAPTSSWPMIGWTSSGRRQVIDDRVEQLLDALVLEGRAADDGLDLPGDRRPAQRILHLLVLDLAAVEVLLEQRVVGLGDRLDQHLAVLRRLFLHVGRDLERVERRALARRRGSRWPSG